MKDFSLERWSFDNLSNLVIIIVLMQINAGILIDKFGEMKDEEKEKATDRENKCFICGEEKETFEKVDPDNGFNKHWKVYWKYIYFIF